MKVMKLVIFALVALTISACASTRGRYSDEQEGMSIRYREARM